MSNLREKIRSAVDYRSETVVVPEWDATVEVRSMSVAARARMLQAAVDGKGNTDFLKLYPALLVACCFDPESGLPVFGPDDEGWLAEKAAGPVELLAGVALRVSGLTDDAVELGKASS